MHHTTHCILYIVYSVLDTFVLYYYLSSQLDPKAPQESTVLDALLHRARRQLGSPLPNGEVRHCAQEAKSFGSWSFRDLLGY